MKPRGSLADKMTQVCSELLGYNTSTSCNPEFGSV